MILPSPHWANRRVWSLHAMPKKKDQIWLWICRCTERDWLKNKWRNAEKRLGYSRNVTCFVEVILSIHIMGRRSCKIMCYLQWSIGSLHQMETHYKRCLLCVYAVCKRLYLTRKLMGSTNKVSDLYSCKMYACSIVSHFSYHTGDYLKYSIPKCLGFLYS